MDKDDDDDSDDDASLSEHDSSDEDGDTSDSDDEDEEDTMEKRKDEDSDDDHGIFWSNESDSDWWVWLMFIIFYKSILAYLPTNVPTSYLGTSKRHTGMLVVLKRGGLGQRRWDGQNGS